MGSAACQTKPSQDPNFLDSLGILGSSPQVNNGVITLQYATPSNIKVATCHYIYTRTILIDFICNTDSLGSPVFVTETAACQYQFEWQSSAACSTTEIFGSNCQVTDPTSGITYDFTDLSYQDYQFSSAGQNFTLHICGNVSTSGCLPGSGACVSDGTGTYSIGQESASIVYTDFNLGLSLSDGSSCIDETGAQNTRSAYIEFVCNENITTGFPQFVVGDQCTYSFIWETSLACVNRDQIECTAVDPITNLTYDLSVLSQSNVNFVAIDQVKDGSQYLVSVCHSLLPQVPGTGCPDESGICQLNGTKPVNLGSVASLIARDGLLIATYTNGNSSGCPPGHNRQSIISFTCDSSGSTLAGWKILFFSFRFLY